MNIVNTLMSLGTSLLFIASIPQIREAWVNRASLRGYSFYGSLLIFLANICFNMAFYLMGNYVSILLNVTTLCFWGIVTYYSLNGIIKEEDRG